MSGVPKKIDDLLPRTEWMQDPGRAEKPVVQTAAAPRRRGEQVTHELR
jgi:hypothetical protein